MSFVEFGDNRVIEIGVDGVGKAFDQLVFGSGDAPLLNKVLGEEFVGVDGLADQTGTGVGNMKEFEGGGDGGGQRFVAANGVD